jgi:hypothetical protein
MTSKRQTTFAKLNRERAVKEKRERKAEKKAAALAERARLAEGGPETPAEDDVARDVQA